MLCPSCAHENRDLAKYCEECATPLVAPARQLAEERKIVTTLFCDLVAFTAASESADPEDVDRMLNAYFAMARREIESYGGVVEKFIGDAVVGVFGVPAAHEDDPERAVRAGLGIAEAARGLTGIGEAPLRLRAGINTGEALVRLGVTPGLSEGFLRGDAINTASRLQSIAPEMGVAVGEATYRATTQVFDYEELEPLILKGKAEAVPVFVARSPRARFGADLIIVHETPFIGREIDLAILKGVFDKTLAASSVELVTVVGEPGIGKSRIVAELFHHVDDRPELITWRQGRCLPYGEGDTFWALGEVVKAHAGILESDDPGVANAKLEAVLPEGPEREWFRQRLLPLLGIEARSRPEREELFTAWRRFLEHVAGEGPTVLVFGDLHWAHPSLLAFLEHLAGRGEGVPLLIVGTARPELFEQHPDYAAGLPNANRVDLAPLSTEETARLVSALLEASVIPAELYDPILERSGGNPLYAEEFVRLLKDEELLVRSGSSWELVEGAEIPFPDSVQALIAARLDTLSTERKEVLANAAVVGKVFWAGAVAAMGKLANAEVEAAMHELARKGLVRPSRHSSIEGEAEYTFSHVLARDVAYAQIPRASRASRHVGAASWLESQTLTRLEDLADVLSHHYTNALELSRAAGLTEQAIELEAPALRFLTLAGERALGLDTVAALDAFERALALTPVGDPERPEVLRRFGEATFQSACYPESVEALEEAIACFRERGDFLAAAQAMGALSGVFQRLNDPRGAELRLEAVAVLEPMPPGPELVDALADVAAEAVLGGDVDEGLSLAERALGVAAELEMPRPARPLGFRALGRCNLGDAGGLQDFAEALELATQAGQGREAANLYNNLGVALRSFEGPGAALEVFRAGIGFADARGLRGLELAIRTSALAAMLSCGALEEAAASAASLAERAETSGDEFHLIEIRAVGAVASMLRGEVGGARGILDRLESSARESGYRDDIVLGLGGAAIAWAALGEARRAAGLLEEVATTQNVADSTEFAVYLPAMVRAALSIGQPDLAVRLAGRLTSRHPCAAHALVAAGAALAEARGEGEAAAEGYSDAATRWEGFGVLPEQGFALLGRGRCLLALSEVHGSAGVLEQAREIFARCGMLPFLEETDGLLEQAAPHRSSMG